MIHSGATRLAGVLGWPVAHSLSPRLHSYWLRQHGIDGAYLPLPVRAGDFAAALQGLAAMGFRGANVTAPHKQAAFALCDRLEASALRTGAVNTIVFDDERRAVGQNTDGQGFLASLREGGVMPAPGLALVLGAGGAARAIAASLLDQGCAVTVTSRNLSSARELAGRLAGLAVLPWPAWPRLDQFTLLINATSGGMLGEPALDFDLSHAAATLVVADIVYAPRRTTLLVCAESQGLRVVGGIGMLLHQAAASFHAWYGIMPLIDAALRDFVDLG